MEQLGERVLSAILQRYARLVARLGDEIGERPMVLPNSEFFPDAVGTTRKGLQKLVDRMRRHAGIEDIPLEVELLGEERAATTASCCGGSCSGSTTGPEGAERLIEERGGYKLVLHTGELGDSVVLVTQVARTLGHLFLVETLVEGQPIDPPAEVTIDLAAVALGFGALMLEGSYIYKKSCGGPRVYRVTHLGCAELGAAFALFVARGSHPPKQAIRELGTTQRAVYRDAQAWLDANPRVVRLLRDDPGALASEPAVLHAPQPSLLGWLGRGRSRAADGDGGEDPVGELEELARHVEPAAAPRVRRADPARDELRALVEEAFEVSARPSDS